MNESESPEPPKAHAAVKKRPWLRFFAKGFLYGFVLVLLVCAALALGVFLAYEHITQPGVAGEPVAVSIPEGATGRQVGQLLAEAGLVEHALFFRFAIRLEGSKEAIKHGDYALPRGLSPTQLLRVLYKGPDRAVDAEDLPDELKVTIPEGLTIAQIAQLFDDADAFMEAAFHPALIEGLGIDTPTLEGFLMPNTYFFAQAPTEQDVVQRMTSQFEKEYAALLEEMPETAQFDKLKIVTVASLVEEEARVDEERALVARVIYNRIERNMPLEMDSTLQYALGKYGERLLSEDKEVDSPYNTYKNRGLPPGPISNPGVASLRASMAPADVDYLYFVSNADGKTHTFSSTFKEHSAAVARYRKEMRRQRREQRSQ